ncbi:MAG: hypothetical protein HY436_00900 [Candidatus Liptonbacteria bacterium]|nr:hypothetical protein [Candidatus Liptonbacteria bacterium]
MTRERMQPPEAPYEPPRLEEAEEKLFHLIVPELRAHAIQPESFHDYREETTRRDMAHVEKLERTFKDESASDPEYAIGVKRGELFEAIIATQIEESNWMGETAEITVPARYDDIVNGVDLIVGFTEEETHSHLGLAVDATESVRGVDRKFLKIKESIENGTLSLIKYFDSEYFHGTLRQVPRVVIGADRSTTKEVTDLL